MVVGVIEIESADPTVRINIVKVPSPAPVTTVFCAPNPGTFGVYASFAPPYVRWKDVGCPLPSTVSIIPVAQLTGFRSKPLTTENGSPAVYPLPCGGDLRSLSDDQSRARALAIIFGTQVAGNISLTRTRTG